MFRLPVLIIAAFFFLPVHPAQAQPPVENCTGADLDGSDMFPFMGSFEPATNDFDMTGAGCAEEGNDVVVCFTPTISCNVSISCSALGPDSVNVFVGPCATSPASCVASDSVFGTIPDLGLTAGENVCVVCENDGGDTIDLTIAELSGSCGALPVNLQSFEIE